MDVSIELTAKNLKAFFVEFLGTATLTFIVLVSLNQDLGIPTPILAGVTLGVSVYTIGKISGAHINPAVTIGQAFIRKISIGNAIGYIIAQLAGAAAAWALIRLFLETNDIAGVGATTVDPAIVGLAEMLGMIIFTFGIGAVVFGKVNEDMQGIVVGASLFLGLMIASVASPGILNPAVAAGAEAFELEYFWGPIVGSVAGFYIAYLLFADTALRIGKKSKKK